MSLAAESCTVCDRSAKPLSGDDLDWHLNHVANWSLNDDGSCIVAEWKFKNFAQALDLVNQIGQLADTENHHPDISFGWGYVKLLLTTHDIGGLHRNDFVMAAKINEIAA